MTLIWPWMLILIPLPWFWLRRPLRQTPRSAVHISFARQWQYVSQHKSAVGLAISGFNYTLWMLLTGWLALCLSLARPAVVGESVQLSSSGREMLLAVDVSGSMEQTDMQINQRRMTRLNVLKILASDFLQKRQGDRVGLVVFGSWASVYAPVSADLDTINQMLLETQIGMAGQKTALGDAIGLSVKKLLDTEISDKVLILMTDGSNTAGTLSPTQAADLAAHGGIRIHTIGIGADDAVSQGYFGLQYRNPSIDLDEETLNYIASKTGGEYFRARRAEDLEAIYDRIDEIEAVERDDKYLHQQTEYFWIPGLLALFLFGLSWSLSKRGSV